VSKIIVLDPGHGGWDLGGTAIDGRAEKHFNLELGLATRAELLERFDCRVVMTRETDTGLADPGHLASELAARAAVANRLAADILVSIHHDSGPPAARGGSLYVWTDKRSPDGSLAWLPAEGNHRAPRSYAAAQSFVPFIKAELSRYAIPWRGDIWCADFGVLRHCTGRGMLLETHFGSNEHDNWAARRPGFVPDLARSIAVGLGEALRLPALVSPEPPSLNVRVNGTVINCLPRIEGSVTVAQVRPVAEALGATVHYDEATMTVHLTPK